MRPPTEKRLLTRSDVEEQFGLSKRFLEVAATKGDGPAFVRIGRSVRYRVADIEKWIDSCVVEPASKFGPTYRPQKTF